MRDTATYWASTTLRLEDLERATAGLRTQLRHQTLGTDDDSLLALGTLSVLRGNALSTGYTVVQGLLGTLIGFGLAAGLVSITADDWFLWMLLPIAGFLAQARKLGHDLLPTLWCSA